jgi:Undecaprenyl-phosphate glucose phosphotransferase
VKQVEARVQGIDTQPKSDPRLGASYSPSIISGLLASLHGVTIIGTGLAIYIVYDLIVGTTPESLPLYVMGIATTTVVILAAFYFKGLYGFQQLKHPAEQVKKIATFVTLVFLVFFAMSFALKVSATFSRVWAFSWYLSVLSLVSLESIGCYLLLRQWGRTGLVTRRIAVIGGGEQGLSLVEHLTQTMSPWDRLVGVFDDRAERLAPGIERYELSGSVQNLISYARANRVDDVLIALPWSAEERILGIIKRLNVLPVQVDLAPDRLGLHFAHRGFRRVAEVPALGVLDKPITGWDYVLKWSEDRLLATMIVLLASPVMASIAVLIKLDSRGPVIFRQRRYGFNNELIEVYKFRTMRYDRDPKEGVPQATRDDNRVTRVGRFLRRTSLDELPQLFNVLKGDMSVVGPRPHAVEHNEQYAAIIGDYFARHRVKPGITGWAQVNGLRGETETTEKMKARVEHDVHYIENWSPLLDLQILAKTAFVVFSQENAY